MKSTFKVTLDQRKSFFLQMISVIAELLEDLLGKFLEQIGTR